MLNIAKFIRPVKSLRGQGGRMLFGMIRDWISARPLWKKKKKLKQNCISACTIICYINWKTQMDKRRYRTVYWDLNKQKKPETIYSKFTIFIHLYSDRQGQSMRWTTRENIENYQCKNGTGWFFQAPTLYFITSETKETQSFCFLVGRKFHDRRRFWRTTDDGTCIYGKKQHEPSSCNWFAMNEQTKISSPSTM